MRGGSVLRQGFACVVLFTACRTLPTDMNVADRTNAPVLAGGDRSFRVVTAGFVHTCALTEDGSAFCWGANDYDQLGADTRSGDCARSCSKAPVAAARGLRFRMLAAGWVANCGVSVDGRTYCWGGGAIDSKGYLGDGALRRSKAPVRVRSDSVFVSVTVGDGHACALTASGRAFCWGQNDRGQLGDGTTDDRSTPVAVRSTERFLTLSAGAHHVCGVSTTRALFCWGDNRWGQLGVGDVAYNATDHVATVPALVASDEQYSAVASGWEHTCALTTTGTAMCWGRNEDAHQLGDESDVTHRGTPAPVAGSRRFEALVAGPLATCARTASGDAYCWGGNYYGTLGNGESDPGGVGHPVRALGGPFAGIALGQGHACAIGTDARLWCWGDQSAGQF